MKMSKTRLLAGLITLLVVLSLATYIVSALPETSAWDPSEAAKLAIESLNMSNVEKHVKALSSFGSRFTGYKGYKKAAEYIYRYLAEDLNLNTWVWTYEAVVPYDAGSTLTILSPVKKTFRVYALFPNLVQTCTGNYTGKLIYVGEGNVRDFEGKNVTGNIVLMKYNTKSNWMYALNLGAKAVVFIEPLYTVRGEGDYKVLEVPIKFPRVMLRYSDAKELIQLLKEAEAKRVDVVVRLEVKMYWKRMILKNIFALIPGKESLNETSNVVILATFFDAYGVVPGLTPAADEACSPAVLLEFARFLKKHRPSRNVIVAFFSGKAIGMAGARYFAEYLFFKHWDKPAIFNGSKGLVALTGDQVISVLVPDFSSDSPAIALVTQGTFYGGFDWTRVGNIYDIESYIKNKAGGVYEPATRKYAIAGRKYRVYFAIASFTREGLPSQVNHLGEVFNHVNIFALTFYTAHSARVLWETPCDTVDKVNFDNIKPQAEFFCGLVYVILSDPRESTSRMLRGTMHGHSRTAPLGFALLRGKVRYYNYSKAWYDYHWSKVLEKDEFIIVYVRMHRIRVFRHFFIVIANSTGDFEIPGVKPSGWALGAYEYQIWAFVINNKTGDINWAPDYGYYGRRLWPYGPLFTLRSGDEASGRVPVNVVLFRCGVIVLHDAIDPTTLTTPLVAKMEPLSFMIYDSRSGAELLEYGYVISTPPSPVLTAQLISLGIGDPAVGYDAIIYIPPNTPVDIVFKSVTEEAPLGILRGLKVSKGEYLDLSITALKYAEEMIKLAGEKLKVMRNEPTLIGSIGKAIEYYDEAVKAYNQAQELLKEGEFTEAYALIYRSWYLARKAYIIARDVYVNIVYTNVMLILLLIPTALVIERLVFEKYGLHRIICIVGILAVLIALSYVLHPGLRIAWNSVMASLSIFSFILTLPVLGFIITGVISLVKEIRRRLIGAHFIDVSRLSIMSAALSIGVGNLKKRPLRTLLTLTSVVCLILSLVLFTSWTFGDFYKTQVMPSQPTYQGIVVKATEEMSISPSLLEYIMGYFGEKAEICPRVWLRMPTPEIYVMNEKGELGYAKAIIGVCADEPLLKEVLKDVEWRGLLFSAIVTSDLAEELDLKPGSALYVAGIKLTVIKVIDVREAIIYLKDIDGDYITPRDPEAPPGAPIKAKERIIIIPYGLAIRIGGYIASVAVTSPDLNVIKKGAKDISEHLSYLAIYYSDGKHTYLSRWIRGYELKGLSQISIPLLVVMLSLLNVMIAAVYERLREIRIYSVLGLSPMHVATMIFSEGFVYAVLGAAVGYLVALILGYIVSLIYPGMYPVDFSSPYPALSILFSMIAVVIAGIYPAVKASGYVTPSLERKWKIPTKPLGDRWYVPLPMSVSDIKSAKGLLAYIAEYLTSVAMEEKFRVEEEPKPIVSTVAGRKAIGFSMKVRLPPYDAALVEDVKIVAVERPDGRVSLGIDAKLVSGKLYLWAPSHRNFVDEVRKQLLTWKGLEPKVVRKYIKLGEKMFEGVESSD